MIQDNSAKWKVRKFTDFASNQALPLGYVHWSISPIVPAGELPLLGGIYDRSLYADLWSWANENGLVISESEWQANILDGGKCDKFSDGNSSTTFRVPKLPNTITTDIADELAVKGNGMTLGFTDGTNNYGLQGYGYTPSGYDVSPAQLGAGSYGKSVGSSRSGASASGITYGVTTDPAKSGIVAEATSSKITGQWLIVAYGTISNIGNLDATNVMKAVEQVQTEVSKHSDISDYIIESYRNGTEWYDVYKSGKVRQGGVQYSTTQVTKTVNFLKPYLDKPTLVLTPVTKYNSPSSEIYFNIQSVSNSAFVIYLDNNVPEKHWVAEGQGA